MNTIAVVSDVFDVARFAGKAVVYAIDRASDVNGWSCIRTPICS
jgi:hypothetical protein